MRVALEGALIGAAVGLFLLAAEYFFIRRAVRARARRTNRSAEIDSTERRRLASLASYCAVLPFGFAFFFWLIWG